VTGYELYLPYRIVGVILLIASCIHVYVDSKRDPRIGRPWRHALMCALIAWPLPYLLWLFWWPGKVRQALFGSDRDKADQWARRQMGKKPHGKINK